MEPGRFRNAGFMDLSLKQCEVFRIIFIEKRILPMLNT